MLLGVKKGSKGWGRGVWESLENKVGVEIFWSVSVRNTVYRIWDSYLRQGGAPPPVGSTLRRASKKIHFFYAIFKTVITVYPVSF